MLNVRPAGSFPVSLSVVAAQPFCAAACRSATTPACKAPSFNEVDTGTCSLYSETVAEMTYQDEMSTNMWNETDEGNNSEISRLNRRMQRQNFGQS